MITVRTAVTYDGLENSQEGVWGWSRSWSYCSSIDNTTVFCQLLYLCACCDYFIVAVLASHLSCSLVSCGKRKWCVLKDEHNNTQGLVSILHHSFASYPRPVFQLPPSLFMLAVDILRTDFDILSIFKVHCCVHTSLKSSHMITVSERNVHHNSSLFIYTIFSGQIKHTLELKFALVLSLLLKTLNCVPSEWDHLVMLQKEVWWKFMSLSVVDFSPIFVYIFVFF